MAESEPAVSNAVAVYAGDIKVAPFGGKVLLDIRNQAAGDLLTQVMIEPPSPLHCSVTRGLVT